MLRCIQQRCAGALDPSRDLVLLHRFHLTPASLRKGALSGYLELRIRQAENWQEREAVMADGFARSDGTTIGIRWRIEHFGLAAVGKQR
jgi:hypothetical protein